MIPKNYCMTQLDISLLGLEKPEGETDSFKTKAAIRSVPQEENTKSLKLDWDGDPGTHLAWKELLKHAKSELKSASWFQKENPHISKTKALAISFSRINGSSDLAWFWSTDVWATSINYP